MCHPDVRTRPPECECVIPSLNLSATAKTLRSAPAKLSFHARCVTQDRRLGEGHEFTRAAKTRKLFRHRKTKRGGRISTARFSFADPSSATAAKSILEKVGFRRSSEKVSRDPNYQKR